MTDSIHSSITPVNIEEELKSSYLDYAMSVIVGRALPDVRDGLKPDTSTCAFLHGSIWHHCQQKIRKICPCGR